MNQEETDEVGADEKSQEVDFRVYSLKNGNVYTVYCGGGTGKPRRGYPVLEPRVINFGTGRQKLSNGANQIVIAYRPISQPSLIFISFHFIYFISFICFRRKGP